MTRLLPGIGNMGGFRKKVNPRTKATIGLVLMSTGKESEWPDELDTIQGIYTYYGDNRKPGTGLHETPKKGNEELRRIFELAHGSAEDRRKCPVILIFQSGGRDHDAIFKGIAVPGAKNLTAGEDLVAVWASEKGKRYQNYKAIFTILDCGVIDGNWVRDIFRTKELDFDDNRTPKALKKWIEKGEYHPLISEPIKVIRSVEEQTPPSGIHKDLIDELIRTFQDDPYGFEEVAAGLWELSINVDMKIDLTRKWRDGGRDAVGYLVIGSTIDPLKINFALEAKCYKTSRVGVKEMSRLISRIKHREFGVMVTTSVVDAQAYSEVKEDGHPVVVLAGRDLAEILIKKGINSKEKLSLWIETLDIKRLT